ncbi:MAG: cupin domain-containing protein [Candidatus Aminicenantes bacterium]
MQWNSTGIQFVDNHHINVKIKKKIKSEKAWIFNDGSQPIQVRIMTSEGIRSIEHLHKTMHEYFYLLQGRMKISVEGNEVELAKDDLIVVEPGERHHIIEHSPDLLLMLLMPPPVPNDKVITQ